MLFNEITKPYYESNLACNFPKVGDDIFLPFYNEHCGKTIFHVDQVYHEFLVSLKHPLLNTFLHRSNNS